jgi:Transposase and inactivated derivatives, IS30 family
VKRKYHKITFKERQEIEKMYKNKTVEEMALKINVHPATIYKELRRGETLEDEYSATLAQERIFLPM